MKHLRKKALVMVITSWALLCIQPAKMFAQAELKALKVGDKIPDLFFNNVINHETSQLKLSDFRGKVVILDFWSTRCAICISLFPKMEALQAKFGDKLALLTVGFNVMNNSEISEFLENRKKHKKELKLPTLVQDVGDKTLLKLFPHNCVPHEVWIDPEGTIIGITDHYTVTEGNIRDIIQGKKLNFSVKMPVHSLPWNTPFLFGKIEKNTPKFGSLFCNYIDSIGATGTEFGTQPDSTFWRFYDINTDVVALYKEVYALKTHQDVSSIAKKMIHDSGNPKFWEPREVYAAPDFDNWKLDNFRKEHLFGYELILPRESYNLNEVCDYMFKDFDRFFKIESKIENRKIKCLSLVKIQSKNKGDISRKKMAGKDSGEEPIVYSNNNIDAFIAMLDGQMMDKRPILNETGSSGKIEFTLPNGWSSLQNLAEAKSALQKAGFDLIETERNMEVLVLYDREKRK